MFSFFFKSVERLLYDVIALESLLWYICKIPSAIPIALGERSSRTTNVPLFSCSSVPMFQFVVLSGVTTFQNRTVVVHSTSSTRMHAINRIYVSCCLVEDRWMKRVETKHYVPVLVLRAGETATARSSYQWPCGQRRQVWFGSVAAGVFRCICNRKVTEYVYGNIKMYELFCARNVVFFLSVGVKTLGTCCCFVARDLDWCCGVMMSMVYVAHDYLLPSYWIDVSHVVCASLMSITP